MVFSSAKRGVKQYIQIRRMGMDNRKPLVNNNPQKETPKILHTKRTNKTANPRRRTNKG